MAAHISRPGVIHQTARCSGVFSANTTPALRARRGLAPALLRAGIKAEISDDIRRSLGEVRVPGRTVRLDDDDALDDRTDTEHVQTRAFLSDLMKRPSRLPRARRQPARDFAEQRLAFVDTMRPT